MPVMLFILSGFAFILAILMHSNGILNAVELAKVHGSINTSLVALMTISILALAIKSDVMRD